MINADSKANYFSSLLLCNWPPTGLPAVLVLTLGVLLSAGAVAASQKHDSETFIIGMEKTMVNALIYIADERNFFSENGISVRIDDHYPSGAAATTDVLNGKIHFSTSAELMLVRKAFHEEPLRALASIDMFTHMKLLARRDRGINSAGDLPGRKIGVPLETAADFKLDRFLRLHKIPRDQVTVVNIQAPQAVAALASARVDALVTWHPFVMELQNRFSDCLVLDVQNSQPMYCLFLSRTEWVAGNQELLTKVMRALLQAEKYVFTNEEDAKNILRHRLGYDRDSMQVIWQEHRLSLRLDQSLILALEDQARWMIEAGLVHKSDIPDFVDYIDIDTLDRLSPEAVSIIR